MCKQYSIGQAGISFCVRHIARKNVNDNNPISEELPRDLKKDNMNMAKVLFSSSPKVYTISHRMFGHMHGVLNIG